MAEVCPSLLTVLAEVPDPRGRRGKRHPLPAIVIALAVSRAHFVDLPMHRRRSFIENLHPIHADVARPGFWIAGVHIRQGDETPAIVWPAFQNWQVAQRKIIRRHRTRCCGRLPGMRLHAHSSVARAEDEFPV